MTVDLIPFKRVWTETDLAELPDDGSRYEIIDGRLYVVPPAGEVHNSRGVSLISQLAAAAPPGWRVLYEIGLAIGEDRFVPDLVVLPPGTPVAAADFNDVHRVNPALVVEIASRSTQTTDAGDKMIAYARGGIPAYWRVTRDGAIHIHQLMEPGVYTLVATVAVGETHDVLWPFKVTLAAR